MSSALSTVTARAVPLPEPLQTEADREVEATFAEIAQDLTAAPPSPPPPSRMMVQGAARIYTRLSNQWKNEPVTYIPLSSLMMFKLKSSWVLQTRFGAHVLHKPPRARETIDGRYVDLIFQSTPNRYSIPLTWMAEPSENELPSMAKGIATTPEGTRHRAKLFQFGCRIDLFVALKTHRVIIQTAKQTLIFPAPTTYLYLKDSAYFTRFSSSKGK